MNRALDEELRDLGCILNLATDLLCGLGQVTLFLGAFLSLPVLFCLVFVDYELFCAWNFSLNVLSVSAA